MGVKTSPRQTPFGVIVRATYAKDMLSPKETSFDLYMEGKYPFQAPKLLSETVSSFPSVSDGRDLLPEILKQKWTPSITSSEIIGMIPAFYTNTLLPVQADLQNQDFGRFHLGGPYYMETWDRKEGMASYYCTENDIKNQKFVKERAIVVTHTAILILELNQKHPGIGYLMSWATLQSLNTIKRSRSEPERITFEWKKIEDNPAYSQQFKIPQANELIDLLSRNMQRIGAVVKRQGNTSVFSEDEVTGKAIKSMNINEILAAIEVYEDNFESNMNILMVNSLLELYQQAIEYFAAVSNSQYSIFLQRMHMLLANETVMNLLQGKPVGGMEEAVEIKSHKVQMITEKKLKNVEEQKIEGLEEEKCGSGEEVKSEKSEEIKSEKIEEEVKGGGGNEDEKKTHVFEEKIVIGGIIKQDKISNQAVIEDTHSEKNIESENVEGGISKILKDNEIVEEEKISELSVSDPNSEQNTIIDSSTTIETSENEKKHFEEHRAEVKDATIEIDSSKEIGKEVSKSPLDLFEI